MTNKVDREEVICPYDKSHSIIVARFTTHLVKCAKNFPNCKKVACIFNSKHVIPEEEIAYHKANCPDRKLYDGYVNQIGDITCPVKDDLPVNIPVPEAEENWEEDIVVSPLETIKVNVSEKPVIKIMTVMGKSKSQRKQIRAEERNRLTTLYDNKGGRQPFKAVGNSLERSGSSAQSPSYKTGVSSPGTSAKTEEEPGLLKKPLRAPKAMSTASRIGIALNFTQTFQQPDAKNAVDPRDEGIRKKEVETMEDQQLLDEAAGVSDKAGSSSSFSTLCMYDDANYYGNYRGGYTDAFNNKYVGDKSDEEESESGDRVVFNPQGRLQPPGFALARHHMEPEEDLSIEVECEEALSSPSPRTDLTSDFSRVSLSSETQSYADADSDGDDVGRAANSLTHTIVQDIPKKTRPSIEVDEHGFLKMPIPGKGRGRGRIIV